MSNTGDAYPLFTSAAAYIATGLEHLVGYKYCNIFDLAKMNTAI